MIAEVYKFNYHNIVQIIVADNEDDAINTYRNNNPDVELYEVKYKLIAGNALVSKTISRL